MRFGARKAFPSARIGGIIAKLPIAVPSDTAKVGRWLICEVQLLLSAKWKRLYQGEALFIPASAGSGMSGLILRRPILPMTRGVWSSGEPDQMAAATPSGWKQRGREGARRLRVLARQQRGQAQLLLVVCAATKPDRYRRIAQGRHHDGPRQLSANRRTTPRRRASTRGTRREADSTAGGPIQTSQAEGGREPALTHDNEKGAFRMAAAPRPSTAQNLGSVGSIFPPQREGAISAQTVD
jgi:hypothetical protein